MKIKELLEKLNNFFIDKYIITEMVDVSKKTTNLPVIVWIDGPRNIPHGKRIKFSNDYTDKLTGVSLIPMTISDNPVIGIKNTNKIKISSKDIESIKQWVILNKDLLLSYSNGDISTEDLLSQIKPLK